MKTRIKNVEDCTKILQVEIPVNLVKEMTEEVYKEIKKVAKVPGFRTGFVPQDLLEKHYSKDAREDILKRLIPEGYKKALENHNVSPVSFPRVFNINFESEKPLTFEAQVDTRPSFKLKSYKGIKVKKKRLSVSSEELDSALSRLQNTNAKYNDVKRPIGKGDYSVCEVEAFIDGRSITKKNKNMWIMADKEGSMLGLGEELVGMEKGQTKEIEAKLPDDYPDKKYAGKTAKFKVLVNEVKEKDLPPLDDNLAKSINIESLDQLKKEIEAQLFARKEMNLKIEMESQIIDRLLKDYKFSVPASMADRQKEVLSKRMEYELSRSGIQKDDVEKRIKELDPRLKEDAKDKVKIYFVLDDIAAKEDIKVDEADIESRLTSVAQSTGRSVEDVKEHYEKEDLLGGLSEEIKEAKVLEFLLKEADVTEE
ncbi:MAG: trigger factor [Candidatus Omnitrophota bacterium]